MSKTILYCRQNRCNKKYYKYFLFFKIKLLIKNELKLHYKLFNFKFAKYVAKYWIKQPPIPAPTIPVILVRAIPL